MRVGLVFTLALVGAPAFAQTATLPGLEPPSSSTVGTGRQLVPPERDPKAEEPNPEPPPQARSLSQGTNRNTDVVPSGSLDLPQSAPQQPQQPPSPSPQAIPRRQNQ